jgi:TolB-like protein/Tfp pilus assembly protein PilF
MSRNGRRSFFDQLKRRRVFRTAALYAVVGWILIEVSDVVFPALEMPDWSLKLVILLVLLGFPIAMLLAWAFDVTPEGVRRSGAGAGEGGTSRRAHPLLQGVVIAAIGAGVVYAAYSRFSSPAVASDDLRSIAVLPFVNISGDPDNEYFSDGLSEELINALAGVPELKVAARTSSFAYKGRNEDVRTIARDLGVATILEGSVRRSGNQVRITVQFIKADDGYHLWSESYDRELEDIFAIQEEIARAITQKLQVQLAGGDERLVKRATTDVEAYDYYLRGRYGLSMANSEESLRQAIRLFEQAVGRDSTYASAYAGIADAYIELEEYVEVEEVAPLARAAALRAVELDDTRAETHTALAHVYMHYDWDWISTERAYRRAVELGPESFEAHAGIAHFLMAAGDHEAALAETRRAIELAREGALDPVAFEVDAATNLGHALFAARRYDEAMAEGRRALQLDPQDAAAQHLLALVYLGRGEYAEAIRRLERMDRAGVGDALLLGYGYARAGRTAEARQILGEVEGRSGTEQVLLVEIALVHVGLGDLERAVDALEEAYRQRQTGVLHLRMNPLYDPLRPEARFRKLMKKAGVPE